MEATWLGMKRPSSGRLARVFMADQPKAPARMASRWSSSMCRICSSEARTTVRDSSSPMTYIRRVLNGTSAPTLTPRGWVSRLSIHCGKVSQSQRRPNSIVLRGMASILVIRRIAASRSSGLQGAKPKPH